MINKEAKKLTYYGSLDSTYVPLTVKEMLKFKIIPLREGDLFEKDSTLKVNLDKISYKIDDKNYIAGREIEFFKHFLSGLSLEKIGRNLNVSSTTIRERLNIIAKRMGLTHYSKLRDLVDENKFLKWYNNINMKEENENEISTQKL